MSMRRLRCVGLMCAALLAPAALVTPAAGGTQAAGGTPATPATLPAPGVSSAPGSATPAPELATLYVARRGWHIDVGFAAADIEAALAPVASHFPGVRYLFFGFGDERYLLAKHRNSPLILAAALLPGRGMVLATALTATPAEGFGDVHVIALSVTRPQLRAAQEWVRQTLAADPGIASLAPGPYEGSAYFSSNARYSAFHTCNTWAAETLKAAGLSVHSAGVVFAGQLWSQVRRLKRRSIAADVPAY